MQCVWLDLYPNCCVCEGRRIRGDGEQRARERNAPRLRQHVSWKHSRSSLPPITISHDVLQDIIDGVITAQEGPLTTRNGDLFSAHPVERRATGVERPDIVEHPQAVPATDYHDFVPEEAECARYGG